MNRHTAEQATPASIFLVAAELHCRGLWTVFHLHHVEQSLQSLQWPEGDSVKLNMREVTALDTAGAWLLYRTVFQLEQAGKYVSVEGLTKEAQSLYKYVCGRGAVPEKIPYAERPGVIEGLGRADVAKVKENIELLGFVGEIATVALSLLASPGRIRWRMMLRELGEAGYKALPIVGLLTFLLGVVIAYQGAAQLRQYGANIYIADLVGLSMVRELSPLIAAILVAGRTGSAYTAQIGTMKVTEELDALRTMAITPMEMLVIPKLLALLIALPLLTVYADITGILGGMVMSSTMLGVSMATFLDRLVEAISMESYLIGIGKAPVFAAIIAIVGCFQGFQVSGSAESVGQHTTMSVVKAIFWIILVDAIFSIVFSRLGI